MKLTLAQIARIAPLASSVKIGGHEFRVDWVGSNSLWYSDPSSDTKVVATFIALAEEDLSFYI